MYVCVCVCLYKKKNNNEAKDWKRFSSFCMRN